MRNASESGVRSGRTWMNRCADSLPITAPTSVLGKRYAPLPLLDTLSCINSVQHCTRDWATSLVVRVRSDTRATQTPVTDRKANMRSSLRRIHPANALAKATTHLGADRTRGKRRQKSPGINTVNTRNYPCTLICTIRLDRSTP